MAIITQHIGTVRTLADAPNPLTDTQDVFDTKGYAYTQSQKDVNADMQDRISELNTFAEQANALANDVNTAKTEAENAKEEAILARNEAVGAVATLPDGVINNNTISPTDTWSSQKIDSTKANLVNPTIVGLREASVALTNNNIDLSLGNVFTKTITGATTLTVSNVPASGTVGYFILKLTNGGAGAVTYPSGTKWSKGTAPTLTASGIDLLRFVTIDGGTRWEASRIQEDSK